VEASEAIIYLLVGGGLMLAGLVIGFVIGRFVPARRRAPKPAEPICGCGHHVSFHDLPESTCHKRTRLVQCTCRRYAGPLPIDSLYAPEISA
jgi:hypothetical protein